MLTERQVSNFWGKVRRGAAAECWPWLGYINPKGYGQTAPGFAHRLSWEMENQRAIPRGHQIDHLCRNRRCVNPAHLELVTPRENTLRGTGLSAQHARKTHCPKGHPYSGDNLITNGKQRWCRICSRQKYGRRKGQPVVIPT